MHLLVLGMLAFQGLLTAAAGSSLRPPAVPLVAHDPYFSIWSPADQLTDADTMHWTGKPHRLTSLVRIDGKGFRLMGKEPANVPPLPQFGLEVLPTRTIYTFEGEGIRLTLTFMTPALPDDLEVLSRPVTYVTWEARSKDDKEHQVEIHFEASPEISVNDEKQTVEGGRPELEGLAVLGFGTVDQPVLKKKGDDVRVDWGRFYIALPGNEQEVLGNRLRQNLWITAVRGAYLEAWAKQGGAFSSAVAPGRFSLQFSHIPNVYWHFGAVGAKPVSRWLMLAYDDEFSIKYFRQNLRPYWRRNGDDAAALLKKAAADYESLKKRCEAFDTKLMEVLRKVGGEKYAQLCALAYRQTFGGNKIVADAKGQPLMFPKENFSNGCIGTVDVLFPASALFPGVQSRAHQGDAGAHSGLRRVAAVALWLCAARSGHLPACHWPGLWHGREGRRPDAR